MIPCRIVLVLALSACLASVALAQSYVGAQKCGECHPFEYQVWSTGAHARAHLTLDADQLKDGRCNTCHTLVEDNQERFLGVQCERCHGPGKYYQAPYVMKDRDLARAVGLVDPVAAHCQQCHTQSAPSVTPFDFKTFWARIDHGKAARLAWERTHGPARAATGTP